MTMRPMANPGLLLASLAPLGVAILVFAAARDYVQPFFTNEVNVAGLPLGLTVLGTARLLTLAGVATVLSGRAAWWSVLAFAVPAVLLVALGPVLILWVIELGRS